MPSESALYERLGGRTAIETVVDRFYECVLADESLASFFEDTDIDRLKRHQKMFLRYATGGVETYDGRSMREAHADMGITDEDFDAVADHLDAALLAAGVAPDDRQTVLEVVDGYREEVVAGQV